MRVATVIILVVVCLAATASANILRKRKYLRWLQIGGYFTGRSEDIDRMDERTLDRRMRGPLQMMKRRFGLRNDDKLDSDAVKLLEEPRCLNKDVNPRRRKKRYSTLIEINGVPVKWQSFPVTIRFKNYINTFSQADQEMIVMNCARAWAEVSGLSFQLVRGSSANIEIEYMPISGGAIGSGQSPNPSGSFLRINTGTTWKLRQTSPGRGVSLEDTICHEMGHNLNLGHSLDSTAIMFSTIQEKSVNAQLAQDDINGIQSIYGGPNGLDVIGENATPPQTTTSPPTNPPPTTSPPTNPPPTTPPPTNPPQTNPPPTNPPPTTPPPKNPTTTTAAPSTNNQIFRQCFYSYQRRRYYCYYYRG